MSQLGWLTRDSIPTRQRFVINLPDSWDWWADFLGALLPLTQEENWEEYGALSAEEMSDEWRAIFLDMTEGLELAIPVGSIVAFAGAVVPDGWLLCNGQAISRTLYSELFALVDLTYGSGNGSTTFNVPDIRGRVVVMRDQSQSEFDFLGEIGGDIDVQLTLAQMPSHTHTIPTYNQSSPGPYFATSGGTDQVSFSNSAGGGEYHPNLQPYFTLNYLIKY